MMGDKRTGRSSSSSSASLHDDDDKLVQVHIVCCWCVVRWTLCSVINVVISAGGATATTDAEEGRKDWG